MISDVGEGRNLFFLERGFYARVELRSLPYAYHSFMEDICGSDDRDCDREFVVY